MSGLHVEVLLLAGVEMGLEEVGMGSSRPDRRNVQQS